MLALLTATLAAWASTFVGNPRHTTKTQLAPVRTQAHSGTLSLSALSASGCDGSEASSSDLTVDISGEAEMLLLGAAPCSVSLDGLVISVTGTDDQGRTLVLDIDVGDIVLTVEGAAAEGDALIVSAGAPEWSAVIEPWLSSTETLVVDSGHELHDLLADTIAQGTALYIDADGDGTLDEDERTAPIAQP